MLISPRPDSDSAQRLARLEDRALAERLRKENPALFSTNRRPSVAIVAIAAIVSLLAGYFIEPALFAPQHRHTLVPPNAHHATRTRVHRNVAAQQSAVTQAPARAQYVMPVRTKHIAVEPLPMRVAQPQKQAQLRAVATAVSQENAQARARAEANFWLQAQEQARAQDRARAVAAATSTAAAQQKVAQTVTAPQPPDTSQTGPAPVGNPQPRVPTGGCKHGRWISIGGHGIGGGLLNFVLQNVHVKGLLPGHP